MWASPVPTRTGNYPVTLFSNSLSVLEALICNGPFRQRDLHNEWIWRLLTALETEGGYVTFRPLFAHNNIRVVTTWLIAQSTTNLRGRATWFAPKAVREADASSPKGTIRARHSTFMRELQPLKCHRQFSRFNYNLHCTLMPRRLLLPSSISTCPHCGGHQICRDNFVDSLNISLAARDDTSAEL